ncbi:Ppx/GppA phosphatase family protein [Acidaminobacter sp.]|uniref:Ppx/GppA phosphatase family protein n=1 Tax=Acidaminobacter sp. TaxID=1872102 RepID=UPI0013842E2E|nr:Ppx/GppA phosphatase family protein [Acidaminobacter sp.]MDK9710503.1 Ppx/GppA family phosphatase [Acidaminobacter sp.]MZQ96158.1 Ppx/GppA family phosphatase [Acidaminobacter sp.]
MEKISVIDMGSNSIRLLMAELEGGKLVGAEKLLSMTRLGAGVDQTGLLRQMSMDETIEAVRAFKALADGRGSRLLGAFATSAVREAGNGHAFARRVELETDVPVEIVSGEEEAVLGFQGVLAGLTHPGRVLVIDIGGGSAELILGDSEGIAHKVSLPLGAVRMTERWLKSDPPTMSEVDALRGDALEHLDAWRELVIGYRPESAVGIGGTATTLGAIALGMKAYDRERIQGFELSVRGLDDLILRLSEMPLEVRREVPGLQPKRADIIIAGALVLETILKTFDMTGYGVSDYDNLEGLLVSRGYLNL